MNSYQIQKLLLFYLFSLYLPSLAYANSATVDISKVITYSDTPEIKLSTSLLCHPKGTRYYTHIKKGYQNSFSTIEECVDAGFIAPEQYKKSNPDLYIKGLENSNSLANNVTTSSDDKNVLESDISSTNIVDTSKVITYSDSPEVKLSTSFLCHPKDSRHYTQIKKGYQNSFSTLEECINAGFIAPKQYKVAKPDLYIRGQENSISLALNKKTVTESKSVVESASKEIEQTESIKAFGGFSWNPAIAMLGYNNATYIEDISIERKSPDDAEGIVRIGKEVDWQMALMLEAHFYSYTWTTESDNTWGVGPFASISLASQEGSEIGSILGLGLMIGMKRENANSFNVGIGYFRDTDFTKLRNGLKDGDSTTELDSRNITKNSDVGGFLLTLSGTF